MIYATEMYAGNHKFILTIENKGDKVELNVTISTPSGWKATPEKLELVKGVSNLVCWIFCLLPYFTAHIWHVSGEALDTMWVQNRNLGEQNGGDDAYLKLSCGS